MNFLRHIIKRRKLGRRHVAHAHGGGYHMPKWTDARWERQVADEMKCFVGKCSAYVIRISSNFSKKLNLQRQSKARKKVLIVGTTANIHREGSFRIQTHGVAIPFIVIKFRPNRIFS